MGLGHVQLAMVQAEAAKSSYGPWVFNCQAPDEGSMHTLLHWGTDEQKESLRPLCEGTSWSCFAMTERRWRIRPTLIQTKATSTVTVVLNGLMVLNATGPTSPS